MIRSKSPERKLREAISSILATHRFFGVLALRMPLVPAPAVKTISGNGETFSFNPSWVAEATHDELKGCIAHIVFACALKHHVRRGARDDAKWQRASRYATAPMLIEQDLWVPQEVSITNAAATLKALPVETLYDRLPDPPKNDQSQPQPQQPPGAGQQPPQGGGAPQPQPGNAQSDSNAGDSNAGEPMPGEIQDAPEGKAEEQDRQWDKASKQAMQVSKTTGDDPGNIASAFDGQHEHRRDWQDLLREYMRTVAPTDYSWTRPNRRFIAQDIYLPSLHGEGMGPVVIAIDTSGSVDDAYINRACAEIFAITEDVKPESIFVIQCDTRIADLMHFDPMDAPQEIEIKGRGGTRFQPVFDYIARNDIRPDVMIYMTDLRGPHPSEPDYPVIWAVQNERQASGVPFGEPLVLPK